MKKSVTSITVIKYLLFLSVFVACKKYDAIETPSGFDVTTIKLTYKVGDSVLINFSGHPYLINFYSGKSGKQ